MRVTVASIPLNAQDESCVVSTSFTRKSSLISCMTVIKRFAINNILRTGANCRKIFLRCRASIGTRSVQHLMSSSVGAGSLFNTNASMIRSTQATAPMVAGIQKLSMPISLMRKRPTDLASPELKAILSPMMLAKIPLNLRPSRKLKITPHIHPSDSPLKNSAKIL